MSMHLKNSREMLSSNDSSWWLTRTSLEKKLTIVTALLLVLSFCLIISVAVINGKKKDCPTPTPAPTIPTTAESSTVTTSPSTTPESSTSTKQPETSTPAPETTANTGTVSTSSTPTDKPNGLAESMVNASATTPTS